MLFALYSPSQVALLVSGNARPYLMAEGAALRFRHALVAEAVRDTVEFDVPLRRRIIAALQQQKAPPFSDYERLAEHAKAIGDTELAVTVYFDLSSRAFSQRAWSVVSKACESLLQLREIDADRFVALLYAIHNGAALGQRRREACIVLEDALSKARSLQTGIGNRRHAFDADGGALGARPGAPSD